MTWAGLFVWAVIFTAGVVIGRRTERASRDLDELIARELEDGREDR